MTRLTLVHLSDLHFGRHVDLEQIAALDRIIGEGAPDAVLISGDLSQRARHGEFQRALAFVERARQTAPVLVVPGNHDTEWWKTPFGLMGSEVKHRKYRRYFSELSPVLEIPGAVVVGTVSSHGLAWGSVSWNPRDLTVKGHLPRSEAERARERFQTAPNGTVRVVVIHHNVLRGQISQRMGLAHPTRAARWLADSGADLVLCGHDHQESVGQIDGRVVVAAASTHTSLTRGKRPSAFNQITIEPDSVVVQHQRWDRGAGRFRPGDEARFARPAPTS